MIVISILDLPFAIENDHEYVPDESRGVTIKAASNALVFKKYLQDSKVDLKQDIMVIHRYINEEESANSRANLDGRPDEFLSNTSYKCEVVITNVSPEHKNF